MAFSYRETQIVKGMILRGDKQHDIAAFFGVNGGRIAEVSTGNCDYPSATPAPIEKLPPAGPYVGLRSLLEVRGILEDAAALIGEAGNDSDEASVALAALVDAMEKLS